MRLACPRAEDAVARALRSTPMRGSGKRLSKTFSDRWAFVLLRLLLPWIPLAWLDRSGPQIDLVLTIWAVAVFAFACLRASEIVTGLLVSPEAAVLPHYPAEDNLLLSILWQRCLRRSTRTLYDSAVILFGVAHAAGLEGPALWAVVVAVLLQWGTVVALAGILASKRALWSCLSVGVGMALLAIVLPAGWTRVQPVFRDTEGAILWALPTGWPAFLVWKGAIGGDFVGYAFGTAPLLLLAILPLALRQLRATYRVREVVYGGTACGPARLQLDRVYVEGRPHAPFISVQRSGKAAASTPVGRQTGPTTIAFRASQGRRGDLFGWALLASLRADLAPVARHFVLGGPWWRRGLLRWALAAAGTCWLLANWEWVSSIKEPFFPVFFIAAFALIPDTRMEALRQVRAGGRLSPIHAYYPVGYWELGRVLLHDGLIRWLLWLPMAVPLFLVVAFARGMPLEAGLLVLAKAVVIGFSAQPLIAVGCISARTNDSERLGIGCLGVIAFALLMGVVALTMTQDLTASWIGCVALLVVSMGTYWAYGSAYGKGRMDLAHDPPRR